jgi:hypothetical protein
MKEGGGMHDTINPPMQVVLNPSPQQYVGAVLMDI